MNWYRVTFSLSKYSGYVIYNSFKLKVVEVRQVSSCHVQLWKSNKVNSLRKKKKQQQRNSQIVSRNFKNIPKERFRLKT